MREQIDPALGPSHFGRSSGPSLVGVGRFGCDGLQVSASRPVGITIASKNGAGGRNDAQRGEVGDTLELFGRLDGAVHVLEEEDRVEAENYAEREGTLEV